MEVYHRDELIEKNQNGVLYHHGIKGMKWGVRRTPEQLGHTTDKVKKAAKSAGTAIVRGAKKAGSAAVTTIKNKRAESKQKKADKEEVKRNKRTSKKKLEDMTNEELRSHIERMRLEQQYAQLSPKKVSAGKKFVDAAINQVIAPSVTNAAKNYLQGSLNKMVSDALKDADPEASVKKQIAKMQNQKQKAELEDFLSTRELNQQVKELRLEKQQADLYDYLVDRRDKKIKGYLPESTS